jgi:hypothetical protein
VVAGLSLVALAKQKLHVFLLRGNLFDEGDSSGADPGRGARKNPEKGTHRCVPFLVLFGPSTVRAYVERVQRDDPQRKKIALVATAHYLVRVMWAMLKRGTL